MPRGDLQWSLSSHSAPVPDFCSCDVEASLLLHNQQKQEEKTSRPQTELQWLLLPFQALSAILEPFLLNPKRPNSSVCFPNNTLLSTHPNKISRPPSPAAALEMVPKLVEYLSFLEAYWDIRYGSWGLLISESFEIIKKEDLGCHLNLFLIFGLIFFFGY